MYDALDSFLNVETWHTFHPLDEERFNTALDKIVWQEKFNADAMAEHMKKKLGIPSNDYDSHYAKAIASYQSKAWAVSDFIRHTGLKKA